MNFKTNIIRLTVCCVVLVSSSCSKFLDLEPETFRTDQNFWQSQDDAELAISGGYALLRQSLNYAAGVTHFAYGDLPSDEFVNASGEDWNDIVTMNWSLAIDATQTHRRMMRQRRYDLFYRVVDQSNRVLAFVPEIPTSAFESETVKNRILGEAYFLRAFTYFYMARVWGGVPLVLQSESPVDAVDVAQASEQEVLEQVLRDIDLAKPLLQWGDASADDRAVRANKGALMALEAHLHAWRGDYAACAVAADSVIARGGYAYVSRENYLRIFEGQSVEGIFEISQNKANEGTTAGIGNYSLREPYLVGITAVPNIRLVPETIAAFFGEDRASDLRFANAFDEVSFPSNPMCIKYANVDYQPATATSAAVRVFKNNIVIFRYADLKLLLAEALAATGRDDAARLVLNEVRAQAGLGEWEGTGTLIEAVFAERGRELFLEGHRYYDQVRMARHHGFFTFGNKMSAAEFQAGKYVWPFDPTILNLNKKLTQNAFWSSKL